MTACFTEGNEGREGESKNSVLHPAGQREMHKFARSLTWCWIGV